MEHIKILKDAVEIWSKRYRSFGDYSVTTLLDPPRIVHLRRRHPDKLERSLASQIAAFIGSGVHLNFEESLRSYSVIDPRYMVERTIMDKVRDRIITGRFDILYDEKHIYDIKTCKVWKTVFDPDMREWTAQQNIYAHLLRERGCDIHSINIVACYMDWNKASAIRTEGYPLHPVVEYQLFMWEHDFARKFLEDKVKQMVDNEQVEDNILPYCTPDEMWVRDSCWAVYKKDSTVKALRLFQTKEDADKYALDRDATVVFREGKRVRCEEFCDCATVCNQYQEWKGVANG